MLGLLECTTVLDLPNPHSFRIFVGGGGDGGEFFCFVLFCFGTGD
jgi:hypothetical protein